MNVKGKSKNEVLKSESKTQNQKYTKLRVENIDLKFQMENKHENRRKNFLESMLSKNRNTRMISKTNEQNQTKLEINESNDFF